MQQIAEDRGVTVPQVALDTLWASLLPEEAIGMPREPRKKGGGRKKKTVLEVAIDVN
jgi:hypothetical protein